MVAGQEYNNVAAFVKPLFEQQRAVFHNCPHRGVTLVPLVQAAAAFVDPGVDLGLQPPQLVRAVEDDPCHRSAVHTTRTIQYAAAPPLDQLTADRRFFQSPPSQLVGVDDGTAQRRQLLSHKALARPDASRQADHWFAAARHQVTSARDGTMARKQAKGPWTDAETDYSCFDQPVQPRWRQTAFFGPWRDVWGVEPCRHRCPTLQAWTENRRVLATPSATHPLRAVGTSRRPKPGQVTAEGCQTAARDR